MTSLEFVKTTAKLLDDKKAVDIVGIDIQGLTSIGDYFVIASGNSIPQVKALADEVEDRLAEMGIEPKRKEGVQGGQWVLLDYGDVIVHIFHNETREYYALERLWADAPRVELDLSELPQ